MASEKIKIKAGKDNLNESLSALMDGEAGEFEFRRILKESASDDALKQKWARYHYLSASLRGETRKESAQSSPATFSNGDMLSRIHSQLAQEGVKGFTDTRRKQLSDQQGKAAKRNSGVLWRMGQGAIAASVAFTVIISGQLLNTSLNTQTPILEVAAQESASVPEFNDNYLPTEFSRVPRANSNLAGAEDLNEVARERLRRAVFQEFVGEPQESTEVLVNFSVTRPSQE